MDASCKLQDNIHKFKLNIYVSRILGTHQIEKATKLFYCYNFFSITLYVTNGPKADKVPRKELKIV